MLCQYFWPRLGSIDLSSDDVYRKTALTNRRLALILKALHSHQIREPKVIGVEFGVLAWSLIQPRLKSLEVMHLTTTKDWIVREILTYCPRLREFRGQVSNTLELVLGPDIGEDEDKGENEDEAQKELNEVEEKWGVELVEEEAKAVPIDGSQSIFNDLHEIGSLFL